MAKKPKINERLAAVIEAAKPANPTLSATDKAHLRSLKKRGFTDAEIIEIARKAGFVIDAAALVIKTKEQLAAEKAARDAKKKQAAMAAQPEASRSQYAQPQAR